MDDLRMQIARSLKQARKAAGYGSAKLLAEALGMPATKYQEYEQGRSAISYETAWAIADLLGCSMDELAGREWPVEGTEKEMDPRQAAMNQSYERLNDLGKAKAEEQVGILARVPELLEGSKSREAAKTMGA